MIGRAMTIIDDPRGESIPTSLLMHIRLSMESGRFDRVSASFCSLFPHFCCGRLSLLERGEDGSALHEAGQPS